MGVVAGVQILKRQIIASSHALGHILSRHFQVHTTGVGAFLLVHIEERLHFVLLCHISHNAKHQLWRMYTVHSFHNHFPNFSSNRSVEFCTRNGLEVFMRERFVQNLPSEIFSHHNQSITEPLQFQPYMVKQGSWTFLKWRFEFYTMIKGIQVLMWFVTYSPSETFVRHKQSQNVATNSMW